MIEACGSPVSPPPNVSEGFLARQLRNYRLTTAEILYHMPDHPALLQSYVWQELDLAPRFPVLRRFLRFWEERLEGRLYRVRIAHQDIVAPPALFYAGAEFVVE